MLNNKSTIEWEKEFDKRFPKLEQITEVDIKDGEPIFPIYKISADEKIKQFISHLLESQKFYLMGQIEEIVDDYFDGLIIILSPRETKEKLKQAIKIL